MSVRKREWTSPNGETAQAWIVDYKAQDGKRHLKTFQRKKDADAYHARVTVDVAAGVHTAESGSLTVAEAARQWLDFVALEGRERATLAQYERHVRLHMDPHLGTDKLARLTTPRINAFKDDLLRTISRPLARKVLISLKSLLKDAKRRGNVSQNVASDVSIKIAKRSNGKLQVGVDIPTPDEIRRMLEAATGRWRPLLIVAVFTGLRASELRGLRWEDVDLKRGELHVRQRADQFMAIGYPKTESSARTIPLGPSVVAALKEWKLACVKGPLDLVFPNRHGGVENHSNFLESGLWPAQVAGGVVDAHGGPKYTGMHALRHFLASWCINRKVDGGLELPLKLVQARLGHATITMTADTYGHLFPRGDDGTELAAAELALLG